VRGKIAERPLPILVAIAVSAGACKVIDGLPGHSVTCTAETSKPGGGLALMARVHTRQRIFSPELFCQTYPLLVTISIILRTASARPGLPGCSARQLSINWI
jgi:hypothetical protein